MRILHLIDAASPQAASTTLALLEQSLGRLGHTDQHTLLLGGTPLKRAAQGASITQATYAGVPFGQAALGLSAIKRYAQKRGPFDLIHCWSIGALTAASLIFRKIPKALTLTTTPPPASIHWLRILTKETAARTLIVPISSTIRGTLLGGGIPESAVHVLRPAIDMGKVCHDNRAALRKAWGASSENTKIVALLTQPPYRADALAANIAMGMADDSAAIDGLTLRMLIHPDQHNRLRAQNRMRGLGQPLRVIQEPRLCQPWQVLPGCDLALALGPDAGGLSLLWAMAANVPIIGEATYAVSEIIEDHHSALLAQPGSMKHLSYRITQLLTDPKLAWKLRDTAHHEAYSFFSRQRYCQALGTVYEQLAQGSDIHIPDMEITGGLRFAGRA